MPDADAAPELTEEHLARRLAFLRTAKDHQYGIQKQLFEADPETLYHADLVAFGVMARSNALIDGFCLLVEHQNVLAAAPLLRLQLDSVIRFNACWLVDDPSDVVIALFNDQPLSKMKDRTGRAMTDSYLAAAAGERHPGLLELYKQASSFIHLSVRQLAAPMTIIDRDTRKVAFSLGEAVNWRLEDRLQAVEIFIDLTNALFQLLYEWVENRRAYRRRAASLDAGNEGSADLA